MFLAVGATAKKKQKQKKQANKQTENCRSSFGQKWRPVFLQF